MRVSGGVNIYEKCALNCEETNLYFVLYLVLTNLMSQCRYGMMDNDNSQ